jgi:hypothetical protein
MRGRKPVPLRIVVFGYIVQFPVGGFAWHHMQYVSGLAKLGHEVVFVEVSGDAPGCYNPQLECTDNDPSYGLSFVADAFAGCGIAERWAYYDTHSSTWRGPRASSILHECARADLLIDLNDAAPLPEWLADIPNRALIDTDPVFSQMRHLTKPDAREGAQQHTVFFSYGENIASGKSAVPDDGFEWRATRQPIDLDAWAAKPLNDFERWTTIMQWESYPSVEYGGARYGTKSASFAPYLDLPGRVSSEMEIALGGTKAPRALLESRGWRIRNPLVVSRTPWTYRDYLQGSKGEFTVAKQGYVASRSGWFSERSACYLASGRPVIVEETGFSEGVLSSGEGVIPFRTLDEAVAGIESVGRDYEHHSRAARSMAEEYFDSNKVLSRLVEEAMDAPR